MNQLLTKEIREFIETARADTGKEELERAWIAAYRSYLSDTSKKRIAAMKHRILADISTKKTRNKEAWTDSEIMLAMNPRYTYTEVARMVGRSPEAVVAARARYRREGQERLAEVTREIYGEPIRVKPIRSTRNYEKVHEKFWKEDELELLRDRTMSADDCARATGRTPAAVRRKRQKLGIRTGRSGGSRLWRRAELSLIESGHYSDSEIAERTGRTENAVRQKRAQIERG